MIRERTVLSISLRTLRCSISTDLLLWRKYEAHTGTMKPTGL